MKHKFFSTKISEHKLIRTVISVYVIGIIGFLLPFSHDFFIKLTPLNLLFSLTVILIAVWKDLQLRHWLIFLFIYLLGFGIEVLGNNTGWPFGNYVYGDVLGIKIFETPLLIGINWLLLILATHLMSVHRIQAKWLIPIAGATMMLIFDVVLEPFAIATGMWQWGNITVPAENFVAWWFIAFILHTLMIPLNFKRGHKVAYAVFLSQIVFFIVINIKNLF